MGRDEKKVCPAAKLANERTILNGDFSRLVTMFMASYVKKGSFSFLFKMRREGERERVKDLQFFAVGLKKKMFVFEVFGK